LTDFREVLRKKHANGAAWLRNTTVASAFGAPQFLLNIKYLRIGGDTAGSLKNSSTASP
jgi:hypothetical protein